MPQMGSVRNGSAVLHQLRPGQTYYWSVQAVDPGFAGSPFASEQQFSTGGLVITPVRRADGVFELGFAGLAGGTFTVLATTNLSSRMTNWTVLGTATEVSPGQFRFTEPIATNRDRFYRVRSP